MTPRPWHEIEPKDAVNLVLPHPDVLDAPRDEDGEVCPWPWEPQQRVGWPMGQYHCSYCGSMVIAGVPHPDYQAFTCPRCARTSHHPEDVAKGYCGSCHAFTGADADDRA